MKLNPDADSTLKLVFNSLDMPNADDPLGLSRAQVDADPRQAGTGAEQFDTIHELKGIDMRRPRVAIRKVGAS